MLRLTYHDDQEAVSDSYPFPAAAARMLGRRVPARSAHADRGACEAARRVEAAMREVERRFERLKDLAGYIGGDPDRPRAA
jgi:hypothetical protein